MRRHEFYTGEAPDEKLKRLLSSSSSSRLPRPGTTTSRPSTVGGVRRTSTTSNPAALRRRARAKKRKVNSGILTAPSDPGEIAYMEPAYNEAFPKRTFSRDISTEAATLLLSNPVNASRRKLQSAGGSMLSKSASFASFSSPLYIEQPPAEFIAAVSEPKEKKTPSMFLDEFLATTTPQYLQEDDQQSRIDPPNTLKNPTEIPPELLRHDADYLRSYRKKVKAGWACIQIQCWWRCVRHSSKMNLWRGRRREFKRSHFTCWAVLSLAESKFKKMCTHTAFRAWKDVYHDIKYTKYASKLIFQKSINSGRLTIPSVNLFFQEDLDLLDNESGFEKIQMERVMVGIRRQILTVLFHSWVSTSKTAKKRRIQACEKLQSALRKCKNYGVWAGELANTGFHMWRRWANYRRTRKAGGEGRDYGDPVLVEWEEYKEKWEERRKLKFKVRAMGGKTFLKNKIRRWRFYAAYSAAEHERMELAKQHHDRAKINLIMRRWCEFCKGRGRAHRRRLNYLLAWKEWAPKKRRLRELKVACKKKVAEVRASCILRNWKLRVQNVLVIYAFGNHRILKAEQQPRLSIVKAAYCFLGRVPNFVAIICFVKWKRYATRNRNWRSFRFWNASVRAEHLMKSVLHAWRYTLRKYHTPIAEKLTLVPHGMIQRGRQMMAKIESGYDPSNSIPEDVLVRHLLGESIDNTEKSGLVGGLDKDGKLITSPVKSKKKTPPRKKKDMADIAREAAESSSSSPQGLGLSERRRLKVKAAQKASEDALLHAINICDVEEAKRLLINGVSANACSSPSSGSRSALHCASEHMAKEFFPIVVLLLRCGADVWKKDARGKRPIEVTINPHVAALLHGHEKRCTKGNFSKRERRNVMDTLYLKWARIGGADLWRFSVSELARVKEKELKSKLQELPLNMEAIIRGSEEGSEVEVLEAFAGNDEASMDDIVQGVMIYKTTLKLGKIASEMERGDRPFDAGDAFLGTERVMKHFESVSWMFEQQQQQQVRGGSSASHEHATKRSSTSRGIGGDEGSDEEGTCRPGEEMIGDTRFVGKDFSKRRRRAAELFCMKVQNGGKKPVKGGGSVSHKVVKQIIERAEKEIVSHCEVMKRLMLRDDQLHKNAFDREIRINFKGVDPKEFEPEEALRHVTGDLGKALARLDKKKEAAASNSNLGGSAAGHRSSELSLKRGMKRRDSNLAIALEDIITISPNMGSTQFEIECKGVRRIGQDECVDMVVKDIVEKVPFRSLVEGFVALGQTHDQSQADESNDSSNSDDSSDSDSGEGTGGGGGGGGGGAQPKNNLIALQDFNDVLPKGWWDKARAYRALMEEAMNLEQRFKASEESVKELKKKSKNLTEAITVVKKSTFDTGTGLREMTEEKANVDSYNEGLLRKSKAAVRKWEKHIVHSEEQLAERKTDLKRLEIKRKKRFIVEEEEEKKKKEEELKEAAANKGKGKGKGKGKKKKEEKKPAPSRKGGRGRGGEKEEEKQEDDMNSEELTEMIQEVILNIEELKKSIESGKKNLTKFGDKVDKATSNISSADTVMHDTVSLDMLTLSQLHTAIDDYEREKKRVGEEEQMQEREKKDIKGMMEDVLYTASLIRPKGAKGIEGWRMEEQMKKKKDQEKAELRAKEKEKEKEKEEEKKDEAAAILQEVKEDVEATVILKDFPTEKVVEPVVAPQGSSSPAVKAPAAKVSPQKDPTPIDSTPRTEVKEDATTVEPNDYMTTITPAPHPVPPPDLQHSLQSELIQVESAAEVVKEVEVIKDSKPVEEANIAGEAAPLTEPERTSKVEPTAKVEPPSEVERVISPSSSSKATTPATSEVPNPPASLSPTPKNQVTMDDDSLIGGSLAPFQGDLTVDMQHPGNFDDLDKDEETISAHEKAKQKREGEESRQRPPATITSPSPVPVDEQKDQDKVSPPATATNEGGEGAMRAEKEEEGKTGFTEEPSLLEDPTASASENSSMRSNSPVLMLGTPINSSRASTPEIEIKDEEKSPESNMLDALGGGGGGFGGRASPSSSVLPSSPSSKFFASDDPDLKDSYDIALQILFKRERSRHREIARKEARDKLLMEEKEKEEENRAAKAREEKKKKEEEEEEKKRKEIEDKMKEFGGGSEPEKKGKKGKKVAEEKKTLSTTIKKDFEMVRSAGRTSGKKIGSDEQFYKPFDCHTMRKFTRKRKEKVRKVAEEKKKAKQPSRGDGGEENGEEEEAERTVIVSEEYEHANLQRVIKKRMKGDKEVVPAVAESEIEMLVDGEQEQEEEEEEEGEEFAWKASASTPYLKSVEDDIVADACHDSEDNGKKPPYRPMKKNMGVSISMLDEKDATSVILDSLGEARRKRVDMESMRLKAEDQFMMIGHAESKLENKRGVGKKYEKLALQAEAQGGSPARLSLRLRQEEENKKENEEKRRVQALTEKDSDMDDSDLDDEEEDFGDDTSLEDLGKEVNMSNVMDGAKTMTRKKDIEATRDMKRGKTEEDEETDDSTLSYDKEEEEEGQFKSPDDVDAQRAVESAGGRSSRKSTRRSARKSTRRSARNSPTSMNASEAAEFVDAGDRELEGDDSDGAPPPVFSATSTRRNMTPKSPPISVESLKRSKSVQEIKQALEEKLKDENFVRAVKAYRVQTPSDGKMRGEQLVDMYKHYPLPTPGKAAKEVEEKTEGTEEEVDETIISAPVVVAGNLKTSPVRTRSGKEKKKQNKQKQQKGATKRTGLLVVGKAPVLAPEFPDSQSLDGCNSVGTSSVELSLTGGIISASVSLVSGSNKNEKEAKEAQPSSTKHFETVKFQEEADARSQNSDLAFEEDGNAGLFGGIFDRTDDDDDDDEVLENKSVEDIVGDIIEQLSMRSSVKSVSESSRKTKPGIAGSLHVGSSGLKHKYAGQENFEPLPAVNEKHAVQQTMGLEAAHSHQFGKKTNWPKVERASTANSSSRPPSSMLNFQQRVGTASTWNTISSRPNTSTSYGIGSGSRPSTGQYAANIQISENAGVHMMRSEDGLEYAYRVYESREGKRGISTPAALPTQMLFDETGKAYGEVLTFNEKGEVEQDNEVQSRAQTAGEKLMRGDSDKLKISGTKVVRNLNSAEGGLRGGSGGDEGGKTGGLLRPATSPTNLPSPSYKVMSEDDRMRMWNSFKMKKMSTATEEAYLALLEDEDDKLFGEGIPDGDEGGEGDYGLEEMTLADFESALMFDHPLRADIERLRLEGPDWVLDEYAGGKHSFPVGGENSFEVKEALALAAQASAEQALLERQAESERDKDSVALELEDSVGGSLHHSEDDGDDDKAFVGTGEGSYRFFDDDEVDEIERSIGSQGELGMGSISVTVKRKKKAEEGDEGKGEVGSLENGGGSSFVRDSGYMFLQGAGEVDEVANEVAVQDALKRFNMELADEEMGADLIKFKDSIIRRRLDEAMVESRALAAEHRPKTAIGDVGGGEQLELLGRTQIMSPMSKPREPLMKINKYMRKVDLSVGKAESKEGEGEEEVREGQSKDLGLSVENTTENESQGDASWALDEDSSIGEEAVDMDMSTLKVEFKREEKVEDEEPEPELTEAEVTRKKRVWNKTSSAPAAFDSFKIRREDTEDSLQTFEFSRAGSTRSSFMDLKEDEGDEAILGVGDVAVLNKPVTPKHEPRAPPGADFEREKAIEALKPPPDMVAPATLPKTPDIKDKLFLVAEDGTLDEDEKSQVWALDDSENKEDYTEFKVLDMEGAGGMEGVEGVEGEGRNAMEEEKTDAMSTAENSEVIGIIEEDVGEKKSGTEDTRDNGKISPASELTAVSDEENSKKATILVEKELVEGGEIERATKTKKNSKKGAEGKEKKGSSSRPSSKEKSNKKKMAMAGTGGLISDNSSVSSSTTHKSHTSRKSHTKRRKTKAKESERDRLIREEEEAEAQRLKEEAEEEERMRARKTAFRRASVTKAAEDEGGGEWERFTKRHAIKAAENREKKAFYEMMKNSPDRMHSKKRATLLGGLGESAGEGEVDLDSDDEWAAVPDEAYEELMKKADDPLDRRKVKRHTFKTLHSEDNDRLFYKGRRGKEVRTKVRGKNYLLKEKDDHEDFVTRTTISSKHAKGLEGLLGMAVSETEKAEGEREGEEKKEVDLASPEKVLLPPIE